MEMNELGLRILKSFESCRLSAYQDSAGVWTLGWGSTGGDIGPGVVWTQEQANDRLKQDLEKFCKGVGDLVQVELNSDQFSALVDFAYNEGLHKLESSHLLSRINASDFDIANEFAKWKYAGGEVLSGLIQRRKAEACLFSSDIPGVETILAAR